MQQPLQSAEVSVRVGCCGAGGKWEESNRRTRILPPGEVHVWRSTIPRRQSVLSQMYSTLAPEERQRVKKYRFAADAERFIASRAICRYILGGYLGRSASDVKIGTLAKGKPYLIESNGGRLIRFNLSHSEDQALYAFSADCDVGIDLERSREVPEATSIVGHVFSASEQRLFFSSSPDNRNSLFLTLWTRREAFLKALGCGLAGYDSDIRADLECLSTADVGKHRWTFCNLDLPSSWIGALAIRGTVERIIRFEAEVELTRSSLGSSTRTTSRIAPPASELFMPESQDDQNLGGTNSPGRVIGLVHGPDTAEPADKEQSGRIRATCHLSVGPRPKVSGAGGLHGLDGGGARDAR